VDSATADTKFMEKMVKLKHPHLEIQGSGSSAKTFTIQHYAGEVCYDVDEFCFKNNDNLYASLVQCIQTSSIDWLLERFPENMSDAKSAPTTAGTKIRGSAGHLVKRLSACTPHYIRCIKPNDKKLPLNFTVARVEHQVKYLGLLENVKVKRAGFAYRHFKDVFLNRFGQIMDVPPNNIPDFVNQVTKVIKEINKDEFEEGKTKIFVKSPETIFMMEDVLFKKLDPEGYKLKLKAFRENEKLAQQKAGKHSLKPKCHIQ
jgi:myosin-1